MILLACESTDSKLSARALLLRALEEEYGLYALPTMEQGWLGKPFFPEHPNIHFNLSHSGPYALCAVGEEAVGVDLEVIRPRGANLPRRVLTPEEYRWYEEQGGSWGAFFTLWTRKESWVKHGGGSVVARPRLVCPPLPGEERAGPVLTGLTGEDWRGAVCTEEAVPALRWVSV